MVAWKRCATGAVGVARKRVVDCRGRGAEIAAAKGRRRDGPDVGVCLVIQDLQVIAEKEDLVLPDRAAKIAAEIVIGKMADGRAEKASGIKIAVLEELVGRAMEAVGPRFQYHVGDGANRPAEFRFVVAGGHVHGLDSLGGRNHDLESTRAATVLETLYQIVVAMPVLPVHLRLHGTSAVQKLRSLERSPRGPGHQVQQRLIVPVYPEWQRGRLHRLDLDPGVGAVGLQQRRRAGDFYRFGNVAGIQTNVHPRAAVDDQVYIPARLSLEADRFHGDCVLARGKIQERIVSAFVGLTISVDPGVDLGNGYPAIDDYAASDVGHCTEQRCVDSLPVRINACQEREPA